jgi:DNA processing protein
MEEKEDWIALNMTPGIGPRAAAQLLERFGSPIAVFEATRGELESVRLHSESIEHLIRDSYRHAAKDELRRAADTGVAIVTLDESDYPELLKQIPDPPLVLYMKGDWPSCVSGAAIGIVGSRAATVYGKNVAEMLGRDLASRGVTVVSGLARGIDTSAHLGALSGNGKTLAVIGTGVDVFYPRENAALTKRICENGGAIVSQFPFGTPPLKDNFPYRNRIISGISHSVILVEATERSGSLITARLAMEQDRDVMAVPGNITSRNSFGTNYLIKSGAKLIQQWQDVVSELPVEFSKEILPPVLDRNSDSDRRYRIPENLDRDERSVYKSLSTDFEKGVEEICSESGLPFGIVSSILLEFEFRGMVKVHPGMRYSISLTADRAS